DEFLGTSIVPASAQPVYMHRKEVRKKVLPALFKQLEDGNAIVRGEAALALGKIGGEEVISKLVHMTDDTNRFGRQLALLAIGLTRDPTAVPFLTTAILDGSKADADRAFAALGLAALGSADALPALATLLHRPGIDRNLEAAATYAMGFLHDDEAAV